MPFWSGEKLEKELHNCILGNYNKNDIDCSAFTLHVGPEAFVTPEHYEPNPSLNTKKRLGFNEHFNIPPGQFAFLLTEEVIKVPNSCIAFISMKAKTKYKGLINVSGFHVDPGFEGRLTFSVFNAGPASIMLRRGMPLFLLWYAELDKPTSKLKQNKPILELDLNIISPIQGPIFSPQAITESVANFKEDIKKEIHTIGIKLKVIFYVLALIGTIASGVAIIQANKLIDGSETTTQSTTLQS